MTEREDTTPAIPPVRPPQPAGASAVGSPGFGGSGAHGYPAVGESYYTTPQYTTEPVAVRRPDVLAGLLLVLAGVAAAVSLILRWLTGETVTGLDLVRQGFSAFGNGIGEVFSSGLWQPLAIVLGGGVLAVLGLLMFVPARSHRFLGVIALVVSLVIVAAVLIPLGRASWDLSEFDLGFWFAMAVAALGLLGSLKALATGRKYDTGQAVV